MWVKAIYGAVQSSNAVFGEVMLSVAESSSETGSNPGLGRLPESPLMS
jgi:hypothetical protein